MTATDYALKYAEMGLYVFPIRPGTKFPYAGFEWRRLSTNDQDVIKEASEFKQYKGCNWALDCGKSDIFVLDVDIDEKKNGFETIKKLNMSFKIAFDVKTPSNGSHFYFKGKGPNTANKIGPGLDTRGEGGYVLIPGSITEKGKYRTTVASKPFNLPSIPPEITSLINQKKNDNRQRVENPDIPACDPDKEANIKRAASYLKKEAPEAVEGSGGDFQTYLIAVRVRDLGVSEGECFELMSGYWNDEKAYPPWPLDDLAVKIRNAYSYARGRAGNATPEAIFPEMFNSTGFFVTSHDLIANIKPPRFIVNKYIEAETTNLWFGEPGSFKSFLTIDMAVAIASGQQWGGEDTSPGAVVYLAGEGHGGLARRVKACYQKRGLATDKHLPFYLSAAQVPLSNEDIVVELQKRIDALDGSKVNLIIVDTLAANFGGGDENSTKDMSLFINNINMKLRKPLGCAILINHHSGHGDKHRARGSSALDAGLDSFSKIQREDMRVCVRRPGKMKDAEPFKDIWFEAEVESVGVNENIESINSLALEYTPAYNGLPQIQKLGENQNILFNALLDNREMKIEDLIKDFKMNKEELGGKYIRQNLRRALQDMLKKNLIIKKGNIFSLN